MEASVVLEREVFPTPVWYGRPNYEELKKRIGLDPKYEEDVMERSSVSLQRLSLSDGMRDLIVVPVNLGYVDGRRCLLTGLEAIRRALGTLRQNHLRPAVCEELISFACAHHEQPKERHIFALGSRIVIREACDYWDEDRYWFAKLSMNTHFGTRFLRIERMNEFSHGVHMLAVAL